jgi:hypothetical protein
MGVIAAEYHISTHEKNCKNSSARAADLQSGIQNGNPLT